MPYRQEEFAIVETMNHWKPQLEKLLELLVKAISRGDGYIEKYFYVHEMMLRAEEEAESQQHHYDFDHPHEYEYQGEEYHEHSYDQQAVEGEENGHQSGWYVDNDGDDDENDFFIS